MSRLLNLPRYVLFDPVFMHPLLLLKISKKFLRPLHRLMILFNKAKQFFFLLEIKALLSSHARARVFILAVVIKF